MHPRPVRWGSKPPLKTLQKGGIPTRLSRLSLLLRALRPGGCYVGGVFQTEAKNVGVSRDAFSSSFIGFNPVGICSRYNFEPLTGEDGADTGEHHNRDGGDGGSHAHQPCPGEGSSTPVACDIRHCRHPESYRRQGQQRPQGMRKDGDSRSVYPRWDLRRCHS
jgi:hypothetical protein